MMANHDSANWMDFFRLNPEFREQRGQADAFTWAANVSPDDPNFKNQLFELVTGYGKTLLAYGVFHILYQRGIIRSMMVWVPTDDQRTQFAGDARDAEKLLGISVEAWVIEKTGREVKIVQDGKVGVFVATYQQLEDGGFFHDLMTVGSPWLNIADECHHLAEDGRWADRFSKLPNVVCSIGLTATPLRSDRKTLLCFPGKPNICVKYKEAFGEEVVKRVIGKIGHYFLDCDLNGSPVKLTTAKLKVEFAELAISDFSQYEVKRQLRYNTNYLNKMLIDPLQDLQLREEQYPGQNQCIIFCMSCRHADHVCSQVNSLCNQTGFPFVAEWVGVGEGLDGRIKPIEENRLIIKIFKKGWEGLEARERMRSIQMGLPQKIDILVQVAKAEEGFSTKRASVLVFLHLIGATPKIIQQIGRGLRRNKAIPFRDDTVSVYASADTEIASVVMKMDAEADEVEPKPNEPGGGGPSTLVDIPDLILIDSRYEKMDFVCPNGIDLLTPEQKSFCDRFGIPPDEYFKHFGSGGSRTVKVDPLPPSNTQDQLRMLDDQVKSHTSLLTTNVLKILKVNGKPQDKSLAGMIKKAINTEWVRVGGVRHDQMVLADFHRKNEWLKSVNRHLQTKKEIPSWFGM